MFSLTVDRAGFPLIALPELGLEVHLFPVTKLQLEAFLAEPEGFGNAWYGELLDISPRRSWRDLRDENREAAFATGIFPAEAETFASWIGDGFRLPTVSEWRKIFGHFQSLDGELFMPALSPPADRLLTALSAASGSLCEISHMQGGVLEWVKADGSWNLLGRPRPQLQPNLFDCRTPLLPTSPAQRSRLFGFRLLRELPGIASVRFRA